MTESPQPAASARGPSRKWSRNDGARCWVRSHWPPVNGKAVAMLVGIIVLNPSPARAAPPPPVKRVAITEGGLFVNGKPFFPVGLGWAAHTHFSLPDAGAKGFNFVVTHGGTPQEFRLDIDDAYANGLYAHASISNGTWQDLEKVEQIVMACRDAPGLLVWELEDEPNIRDPGPEDKGKPHRDLPYRVGPERFKPVYDLIKRLDPVHPVSINLAYGYLKDHQDYRDVTDIQSGDVYPLPAWPLAHVAQFADSVMKGQAGKPGWMWIQMAHLQAPGHVHENGVVERTPTITEVRCMTYMAVAHGISGVEYFSFHFSGPGWDWWINQSEPAYWAQWADLTAELRLLTPYLLAPKIPGLEVEIIEGPKAPREFGYTALHLSLRRVETGYFLIAVNGFKSPIKARFTVPVPADGLASDGAAVRFEHRLVAVKDGVFEDAFEPYAVHLYELPFKAKGAGGPTTESISWPRWQRRPRP